ncbi:hypothetical protein DM860_001717 [Cuscuta australis]|uniref:Uncharacterized protein n=1 Tax=Cuscuta australis TaxID=267555 RepID=A0A328EDB9_9ASTE|nr:hypothetical protein DM860_001717 [Cuscuta australis]
MASRFQSSFRSAAPRAAVFAPQRHHLGYPFSIFTKDPLLIRRRLSQIRKNSRIQVSDGGDLLQTAVDLESKSLYFQKIVENSGKGAAGEEEVSPEALGKKTEEFKKILDFSSEERDKIQRMQVIDRAAAAISAARALLKENPLPQREASGEMEEAQSGDGNGVIQKALNNGSLSVPQPANTTPGPSFWAWTPPPDSSIDDKKQLKLDAKVSALPNPSTPVMEKERSADYLLIPFESGILGSTKIDPLLPPLQSLVEVDTPSATVETPQHQEEEHELGVQFSTQAAEAVLALEQVSPTHGVNPDGSKWWNETGTEQRPDGVLCKWTVTRGVSADKAVEWENKYWEAADEFGYKELGSEKSGRDAVGNVWREYWRESMSENAGLVHMEKTADKWGKNGRGEEWQEQWWEKYDASGQAEKWAHKWCSIDPNTPLLAGHAHVWHERWGEKFDGQGGAVKYTDKWAERCEGDGWSKWGDKWDEHFDANGRGVKQGEKWWEGRHGDRWNRMWGEGHNGSGWVHKYGKSSSGEHWDTHVRQDTWYERVPHFGFYHCFENSVQLRQVKRPSESEES